MSPDAPSDLDRLRTDLRAWLAERYPRGDPERDDDRIDTILRAPEGHSAFVARSRAFHQALTAAGFGGLAVPTEYGGHGLSSAHDHVVAEVVLEFDCPSLRGIGIGPHLALPTLLRAGTEEQKRRYIPKIFSGEEMWCQLFSEPDAGSDLVSLRTRAVPRDDAFVINGQKVWSSYAADAHFGLLIARTDPDATRPHSGITMFIIAMDTPGVAVHPLVDMAGGTHFNEVFLQDVVLGPEHILGGLNSGWTVASGTLGGERKGYMGGSGRGRRRRQVIEAATRRGVLDDPLFRQRIASVVTDERLLELVRDRIEAGLVCGGNPTAGSMMKVLAGSLEQKVAELLFDLVGPIASAWDAADVDGDRTSHSLNASRQSMIAGGTHQIQRNLLGERILGLPR